MTILPPTLILPSLLCFSKKRLFEEIAQNAAAQLERPWEELLSGLNAREEQGSTALPHGIAIPHAVIAGLSRTQAVLGILDAPVAFNSIDSEPQSVDIAYTLFISDGDDYDATQSLLQKLTLVFANQDLLNSLRMARNELGKINALLKQIDRQLAQD